MTTCLFGPANEPWECSVHRGIRTSLDEPQCDIARPAEPFNDAYLDNIRQAIAEGRNPASRYTVRRLLATIDAFREAAAPVADEWHGPEYAAALADHLGAAPVADETGLYSEDAPTEVEAERRDVAMDAALARPAPAEVTGLDVERNAAGDVIGLVGAAMDVFEGHVGFVLPNDEAVIALGEALAPYYAAAGIPRPEYAALAARPEEPPEGSAPSYIPHPPVSGDPYDDGYVAAARESCQCDGFPTAHEYKANGCNFGPGEFRHHRRAYPA